MQLQTTAGHPTFQFGEIFGDYFVGTAWSSVTSPAQCAVCGHQLGFLLLQVASNKYTIVLAVALRGDHRDQGRAGDCREGGSRHQYQVNHVQVMTQFTILDQVGGFRSQCHGCMTFTKPIQLFKSEIDSAFYVSTLSTNEKS